MSQNRSHAVMAQRSEPHDSLEFFPTPPWATRALCEWIKARYPNIETSTCWEPACGEGHMVRPLKEYFAIVYAEDVHDYGYGKIADFLFDLDNRAAWIITNPPFRLGDQFAMKMIERSKSGCAILVRTAFLESASRYTMLFKPHPPSDVLQFVERVPMQKGILNQHGSTATAYCWIVWRKSAPHGTQFHWIAPCRKRLEKQTDYEVLA